MKNRIQMGSSGRSLTFIQADNYPTWLSEQPQQIQSWLSTTFNGEGFALLPADDGEFDGVVVVVKQLSDRWLAGDLATRLPAGDYYLCASCEQAYDIGLSWALGGYQYSDYKQCKANAQLYINDEALVDKINCAVDSINLVRDLVNTPASDMMPEDLSDIMKQLAQQFDGQFSEIVGDDLLEQNYPTIHAVGRASTNAPRLIELTWGNPDAPKVTLVGKGVCFDSGGLDLKPASGMRLMKKDMGGAAHVIGLAHHIMAHQLNIHLTVLVPAVENAVSSNAFRPGDVITTRSGLTVEIDNTDAEGRLVMCDAITKACHDDCDLLIDFATLTGAMRIALGTELPGFFANDDEVANQLYLSGEQVQDPVWRMPLVQSYRPLFKSDIADFTNCGSTPFGGAITAALYLENFVTNDVPWVHFDVMAYNTRPLSGRPVGGEAFGLLATFDYLSKRFG